MSHILLQENFFLSESVTITQRSLQVSNDTQNISLSKSQIIQDQD